DGVQDGVYVSAVCVLADQWHQVVSRLQVLVVFQHHEVRVVHAGGEQLADLDRPALQGVDGERTPEVQLLHFLELDAVEILQPDLAEGVGGAVRRRPEYERAGDGSATPAPT